MFSSLHTKCSGKKIRNQNLGSNNQLTERIYFDILAKISVYMPSFSNFRRTRIMNIGQILKHRNFCQRKKSKGQSHMKSIENYRSNKVVLSLNLPISGCMPYTNCTIFRSRNYNRKLRMKTYGRDIVCMAFKSLDTTFSLIVPHLSRSSHNT